MGWVITGLIVFGCVFGLIYDEYGNRAVFIACTYLGLITATPAVLAAKVMYAVAVAANPQKRIKNISIYLLVLLSVGVVSILSVTGFVLFANDKFGEVAFIETRVEVMNKKCTLTGRWGTQCYLLVKSNDLDKEFQIPVSERVHRITGVGTKRQVTVRKGHLGIYYK